MIRAGRLCLLLAVAGCSVTPSVPPPENLESIYHDRAQRLHGLDDWALLGRLSIDDSHDGGSGRLHWQRSANEMQLDFRGSLGQGAWRLHVGPGQARLERGDGSVTAAESIDELVQAEMGWSVPVEALRWWVLGVAAPGGDDALELDARGRPIALAQLGWTVRYDRYLPVGDLQLPGRLEATRGSYRVRLAVKRWTLGAGAQ